MARLTADSNWLLQQSSGVVTLFHEYSQEEIVKFDPSNADATAKAQKIIYDSNQLTDEEKCFAHFWSGYFYAHAKSQER